VGGLIEVSCKIDGVIIQPLRQINDGRGAVLHMLRKDSPVFNRFGEVYFSEVRPNAVKAWKRHREMTQYLTVPTGKIRLVIYDDRSNSETKGNMIEFIIGRPDAYHLICIPPLLWYGFQGVSKMPAIVANCTDIQHDPEEVERLDSSTSQIPFIWFSEDTDE